MRIALDVFGSDFAPDPEIAGAIAAIKEELCSEVILVGDEEIISKELEKYFYDSARIKIEHAKDRIGMGDEAAGSVRSKRDSSMVRCIALQKEGKVNASVSAGNTGAMMSASLLTLGRMKNVLRPAIAGVFPTQKEQEIILDIGANVDCSAEHLLQFAIMGSKYYQYFFQVEAPRISLLNIGEESVKGNVMSKEAHRLLAESKAINFIGNIEGKDILTGITDVVVCDGFVGNVILKTIEGTGVSIFHFLKEQMNKDWISKLGALLSYPAYSYIKKKLDHTEYGGALLVGLNGISVVAHGRSNAKAIKNAIKFAARIAESGFVESTREYFESL